MGSLPNRLARLITATLTVWCLGCSSFDLLLDHLLGKDLASTVSCMQELSSGPIDAVATIGSHEVAVAKDAIGCGCTHCVALRTIAFAPGVKPPIAVQEFAALIDHHLSIEPVPLVPPPLG